MYISKDSLPYCRSGTFKVYYHFSVSGFEVGTTYTFTIRAMTGQGKLYSVGLRPVYKVTPSDKEEWKTIPGSLYWKTAIDGFQIKFQHEFDCDPNQTVYFAFTYPFGYTDCMNKIDSIQEICDQNTDIYFHRE